MAPPSTPSPSSDVGAGGAAQALLRACRIEDRRGERCHRRDRPEGTGDRRAVLDEQLAGVETRELIGNRGAAEVAADLEQLQVLRVRVERRNADPAVRCEECDAA